MKKLLVLGGGTASYDVVKTAKEMGIYVICVDMEETPGISRRMADEEYRISTTDSDKLVELIKEKNIDGVFCGPSELRIMDALKVSQQAGLHFYCTQEQWDLCQDKAKFKALCRKFNVPCVPEYEVTTELRPEDLAKVKYPVIVKPVDGCSSAGLSVCWDEESLKKAVFIAEEASRSKQIIVEKFITSDYGFGCRYIADKGEIFLSAVNDRYTVDKVGGAAMISSTALFPSKKTDYYIEKINSNVIEMFKSIGIKNGTLFMQALYDYDDNEIYFHEMGLRLSGGLIYPMLKASCGYSDLEMMIRLAVGGEMVTGEEADRIDPYMHGNFIGSLCIPLKPGKIKKIEGLDTIIAEPEILDCSKYYSEDDEISEDRIGTLGQHFCRFKMMTKSENDFKAKINWIQSMLKIEDYNGNDMIYSRFDVSRME